jgi:hypothetical protein
MSLLTDAPPSLGVLETLEVLASSDLSVREAGAAWRVAAGAYGRLDAAQALLLAMLNRGNGAAADGATDTAEGLLVVTAQGTLDLETGDGRAVARMLLTMAAKASDDTSRRVRRKKLEQAEQGLRVG